MRTSEKGLALIRQFEGLRLRAYKCPAGIPTIGYGHTAGVKMGQEITRERAEELLLAEVDRFAGYVERLVTVPLTQGQFDALVAWTYNLGPGALEKSTMLRRLNAGDYASAAAELERWNRAGGQVLAGLVRRRAAERAMFEGVE
ncbi:lysozyme [Geopseudomonas sagittaria]|uniref:Lysozyme n=1 Tax=Geopseudomonas sagittaria TaxID=1135990 RepID=A0A1I5YNH6_9GAMM|nr:lysozyme [Pseudomonas sagittaria]SFQ45605.1 lysozyme [Pseudomonas sagittaria]